MITSHFNSLLYNIDFHLQIIKLKTNIGATKKIIL